MKKIMTYFIVGFVLINGMACGTSRQENTQTENESKQENSVSISEANEILTKVWDTYKEDEKFYVEGPMRLEEADAGYLERAFCFPAKSVNQIDDVAMLLHSMNANTFSAAAYHITEGTDMQALAEDIKDKTLDNQWLCGFPERLIIVAVGDEYLVTAFGNGDVVDNFKGKLLGAYDTDAELMVEENI